MGQQMLLILLGVAFFFHSIVHGIQRSYVGEREQQTYSECFTEEITSVQLSCSTGDFIHINSLTLSTNPSCGSLLSCAWRRPPYMLTACEGKSSCQYHFSSNYSPCSYMNQINLTFQCIDASYIWNMCPSEETSSFHQSIAYFTTPGFTEPPHTYGSNTVCECTMTRGTLIVELAYLDLERASPEACYDYLEFNDGSQSCSSPDIYGVPIRKTFYSKISWKFVSDHGLVKRGGWLNITNDGLGRFSVTCAKGRGTTTRRNIPDSTPTYSSDEGESGVSLNVGPIIGVIIGGVIGIIILIAIFIVIAVCVCKRRAAIQQRSNLVAFNPAVQTAAVYSSPPTDTVGSADMTLITETAGNDLPPAYSSLPQDSIANSSTGASAPSEPM